MATAQAWGSTQLSAAMSACTLYACKVSQILVSTPLGSQPLGRQPLAALRPTFRHGLGGLFGTASDAETHLMCQCRFTTNGLLPAGGAEVAKVVFQAVPWR